MSCATISPHEAKRRLDERSAVLVDIREPLEHAREKIAGARLAPLSGFEPTGLQDLVADYPAVVFHCQSGSRTRANADTLRACGFEQTYVLDGGMAGWKAAGLPTQIDRKQPIELQRQVQIAAGSLVLTGLVLAVTVSPWFAGLAAFVGAGLTFAGISGWCGMAKLLAIMPWNRLAA